MTNMHEALSAREKQQTTYKQTKFYDFVDLMFWRKNEKIRSINKIVVY